MPIDTADHLPWILVRGIAAPWGSTMYGIELPGVAGPEKVQIRGVDREFVADPGGAVPLAIRGAIIDNNVDALVRKLARFEGVPMRDGPVWRTLKTDYSMASDFEDTIIGWCLLGDGASTWGLGGDASMREYFIESRKGRTGECIPELARAPEVGFPMSGRSYTSWENNVALVRAWALGVVGHKKGLWGKTEVVWTPLSKKG